MSRFSRGRKRDGKKRRDRQVGKKREGEEFREASEIDVRVVSSTKHARPNESNIFPRWLDVSERKGKRFRVA